MSDHIDHAAEAVRLLNTSPLTAEAQVHATLALVEQQRIANKLKTALVEQIGSLARTQTQPGYPLDPAIDVRTHLDPDEWKGLGL